MYVYVVPFHPNFAKLRNFLSKTGQHLVQIHTQIIYGVAVWNENVITLINASYRKKQTWENTIMT